MLFLNSLTGDFYMSLITLTTDFGTKDHFVGAVKGAIYTELPDARIVDITHEISPFSITETAYILKNSYKSFPEKSIHIVGVDAELSTENKHIAILLDNHYFICPDNGIISMIASEINPTQIVEINIHDRVESSFPVLDVFVQVACFIARGGSLGVIGKEIQTYKKMTEIQPKINANETQIIGSVIYIDNYGNLKFSLKSTPMKLKLLVVLFILITTEMSSVISAKNYFLILEKEETTK